MCEAFITIHSPTPTNRTINDAHVLGLLERTAGSTETLPVCALSSSCWSLRRLVNLTNIFSLLTSVCVRPISFVSLTPWKEHRVEMAEMPLKKVSRNLNQFFSIKLISGSFINWSVACDLYCIISKNWFHFYANFGDHFLFAFCFWWFLFENIFFLLF